jgi:beta-galactosidase
MVVPVSILDTQGRLVPNADNQVEFQLSGPGRIVGVGNGNPADHDSVRGHEKKAFHGRCMAVLQAGSKPGLLQLTVTSLGLPPATLSFQTSLRSDQGNSIK